jgi:endonuclease YncB( thermonuclease family)
MERFGKEASEFTRHMVEGKRVRLEFDDANAARGHKDNTEQKRTLAYVYLGDGTLLNAEIIRQGYGFALTRYTGVFVRKFPYGKCKAYCYSKAKRRRSSFQKPNPAQRFL